MTSSLVNSLAKMYDPKPLHGQKPAGRKSLIGPSSSGGDYESGVDSLSGQMERLLAMQHTVLTRLDSLSQDVRLMGKDLALLRREGDMELRGEVARVKEGMENQNRRLEGLEKLAEGTLHVISFIGETVKSSRLMEILFKPPRGRGRKNKDDKKQNLKTEKKKRPPDSSDSEVQPFLQEQVEKLNRQNVDLSLSEGGAEGPGGPDRKKSLSQSEDDEEATTFEDSGDDEGESSPVQMVGGPDKEEDQEVPPESEDVATCSKRRVTGEDLVKDESKKSRVDEEEEGEKESEEVSKEAEKEEKQEETTNKEFFIDSSPPPVAPFDHRIVTPKPHQIASFYTINRDEVLGGGRFGQVHKCVENSSGLTLAAKIIKAKSQKEKDVVRNEIQVMNQLNHSNLIQLYAAFESRHDIILVMEYVEGGELFDRIIDENYNLTELDTVLFIRQICEGLQYMHKMYILHLDLKPENILCVNRATNKIKIIDFGLARRYKPREKLKVNFGTPEFLAPEVINYEFVSFPTDMWSLGVIAYMLISGLSPFLGDDDNETLNNILACQWNFEEEEFSDISDEAKDFITLLLVKSKSWRMSASESLRHPWLSDRNLHYRLNFKKKRCHSPRPPTPES